MGRGAWQAAVHRALAPHERLPEILVVPREKTPTGAASQGRGILVGCGLWSRTESDTTEVTQQQQQQQSYMDGPSGRTCLE